MLYKPKTKHWENGGKISKRPKQNCQKFYPKFYKSVHVPPNILETLWYHYRWHHTQQTTCYTTINSKPKTKQRFTKSICATQSIEKEAKKHKNRTSRPKKEWFDLVSHFSLSKPIQRVPNSITQNNVWTKQIFSSLSSCFWHLFRLAYTCFHELYTFFHNSIDY